MKDLNTLIFDDFNACLGQRFTVTMEQQGEVQLELLDVKLANHFNSEPDARQPFSVLFRGPLEAMLPQQIYRIENEQLGELAIFLVPAGPDACGILYAATFN